MYNLRESGPNELVWRAQIENERRENLFQYSRKPLCRVIVAVIKYITF